MTRGWGACGAPRLELARVGVRVLLQPTEFMAIDAPWPVVLLAIAGRTLGLSR